MCRSVDEPQKVRARDLGIDVGVMKAGPWNAITDVPGVSVGHKTVVRGEDVRTGVTVICPHDGNIFLEKTPAAISTGNGFGKLTGQMQVEELGHMETPVVLTNTLSVGTAVTALVEYTMSSQDNNDVKSVNALVGETNDGYLNDIRGLHISQDDILEAIATAHSGPVEEGSVGAGTGTRAFGFKGGIGTASRTISEGSSKNYVLGVLVQTNFGGLLDINGAPVGRELGKERKDCESEVNEGGSCVIVIATDAPLCPRNLKRLAARSLLGLARTGSTMNNSSGEYAIAFSNAYHIPHNSTKPLRVPPLLSNDSVSAFFRAAIEATQEAVYNSMFMASTVKGYRGHLVEAVPAAKVVDICKKYNLLHLQTRFP